MSGTWNTVGKTQKKKRPNSGAASRGSPVASPQRGSGSTGHQSLERKLAQKSTHTLVAHNVVSTFSEVQLREHFSQFGKIVRISGLVSGSNVAFITFFRASELTKALVDQYHDIGGRMIKVDAEAFKSDTKDIGRRFDDHLTLCESTPVQPLPSGLRIAEEEKPKEPFSLARKATWKITIRNSGTTPRRLISALLMSGDADALVFDYAGEDGVSIGGGGTHRLGIHFTPRHPGISRLPLSLLFEGFRVVMWIRTEAGDYDDYTLLAPSPKFSIANSNATLVGQRVADALRRRRVPATWSLRMAALADPEHGWAVKTLAYDVPPEIASETQNYYGLSDQLVSVQGYRKVMHDLLWVEESAHARDDRQYDLHGVTLEAVPYDDDSSSSRPVFQVATRGVSLTPGDSVYVWRPGTLDDEWEGRVIDVKSNHVTVSFAAEFPVRFASPYGPFDVRFERGRFLARLKHKAVDDANLKLLFPVAATGSGGPVRPPKRNSIKPFNAQLASNNEQMSAVAAVLARPVDAPFLLFGAAGTGKTTTLVEMVKQALAASPKATDRCRVLVCAPTSDGADVLARQLFAGAVGDAATKTLFRLYAPYHARQRVPAELERFAHFDAALGVFSVPPLERLSEYRIVVTSVLSAGALVGHGLPSGHFSHVFIDDASTAAEWDVCVPLMLAGPSVTTVVLAGDERQAGPHLLSPAARAQKLDQSLMERLLQFAPYRARDDSASHVVDLRKQYRMHPRLLAFPSSEFYLSRLEAVSRGTDDALSRWKRLPTPGFPAFFYGIEGRDEREGEYGSFFNRFECTAVVSLVVALLRDTSTLHAGDVGVVTPFPKQVQKIRTLLHKHELDDVTVGAPGDFCGVTKRAMFVSAVRAREKYLEHDDKLGVGFFDNARLFNTAVAPVTSLLVVVCSPRIFWQDPTWRRFIQYVSANGGYEGPSLASLETSASSPSSVSSSFYDSSTVLEMGQWSEDDSTGDDGGGGGSSPPSRASAQDSGADEDAPRQAWVKGPPSRFSSNASPPPPSSPPTTPSKSPSKSPSSFLSTLVSNPSSPGDLSPNGRNSSGSAEALYELSRSPMRASPPPVIGPPPVLHDSVFSHGFLVSPLLAATDLAAPALSARTVLCHWQGEELVTCDSSQGRPPICVRVVRTAPNVTELQVHVSLFGTCAQWVTRDGGRQVDVTISLLDPGRSQDIVNEMGHNLNPASSLSASLTIALPREANSSLVDVAVSSHELVLTAPLRV